MAAKNENSLLPTKRKIPISDFENKAALINKELASRKFGINLNVEKINFQNQSLEDKENCINVVSKLLSEIKNGESFKNETFEEINKLEKENKRKLKLLNELKNNNDFLTRKNDQISIKLKENEERSNLETKKYKKQLSQIEKDCAVFIGKFNAIKHRLRKSELECRNLRERLNSRLGKNVAKKYNFCLNSEKIITDFHDETKKINYDENIKKRLESTNKALKTENVSLRKSVFSFKNNLISCLDNLRKESEFFEVKNILFDLEDDYSELPFSAFGDVFEEGIQSGLNYISDKIKHQNTPKTEKNAENNQNFAKNQINQNQKMLKMVEKMEKMENENKNYRNEKNRLNSLSIQVESEQLKIKVENFKI